LIKIKIREFYFDRKKQKTSLLIHLRNPPNQTESSLTLEGDIFPDVFSLLLFEDDIVAPSGSGATMALLDLHHPVGYQPWPARCGILS
jgi:hypothetical protein